jgi:hypothetical protein
MLRQGTSRKPPQWSPLPVEEGLQHFAVVCSEGGWPLPTCTSITTREPAERVSLHAHPQILSRSHTSRVAGIKKEAKKDPSVHV